MENENTEQIVQIVQLQQEKQEKLEQIGQESEKEKAKQLEQLKQLEKLNSENEVKEEHKDNYFVQYEKRVVSSISSYKTVAILSLMALPIGAVIALAEVLFGKGLEIVTEVRMSNPIVLTAFLGAAGIFIALLYYEFGNGTEKGMGLVFEASEKKANIPFRLAPLVIISSWLTHLCGGSAGREGVAVQIGATIADQVGQRFPKISKTFENSRDTFIICGIAAGFAGLFQTPFAAIMFSLEVLVCGELKYKSLFPAIISAFTSFFIANLFGLESEKVKIAAQVFDVHLIWKLLILGLIFGVVGAFFASTLRRTKKILKKLIPNPIIKTAVFGVLLSIAFIFLYQGRYSGFGTNITMAALTGGEIYHWDWILKLVLTVLTLSAGFMGGELTPLFSIGSSLGAMLAVYIGLPVEFVAALGYIALFGSATNTFLAPILIGAEIFGAENLPAFVIICAVAFFANFDKTIYGSQKKLTI